MTEEAGDVPPPIRGDRYKVLRRIAKGGMATVWLAQDLKLDRQVALKFMRPELASDPLYVQRFRNEAQAAGGLDHPHIVLVFDWDATPSPYIAMQYIQGRTLDVAAKERPFNPDWAAKIAADVADALEHAHRRRLIHRDIKPSNLLLDNTDQIKVADFGIARVLDNADRLTPAGLVPATPGYASPEQAQGKDVDRRTDIYSLGVVLYELAAGRLPFEGANDREILFKHVNDTPPPLSALAPATPVGYAAVVEKAMAKDPADRYQSAAEMAQDLRHLLDAAPPTPTPSTPPPPPARRPRAGSLILVAALLLSAVLITALVAKSGDHQKQTSTGSTGSTPTTSTTISPSTTQPPPTTTPTTVATTTTTTAPQTFQVTFGDLCSGPALTGGDGCKNGSGTRPLANGIFDFQDSGIASIYPAYNVMEEVTPATCSSLALQFVGVNLSQINEPADTAYIKFLQNSGAQTASSPVGVAGSITVTLDKGPLYVEIATTYGDKNSVNTGRGDVVDVMGTATCTTDSGT